MKHAANAYGFLKGIAGIWWCRKPVNPIARGCTDFHQRETPDAVNHPAHYQSGGLECIDVIRAVTGSGFSGFLLGNVLKYLWRYRQKNGTEDLKKAAWYLDRLIKAEETP